MDAGLKYRGFSLNGEYYVRWLDDFELPDGEIVESEVREGAPAYGKLKVGDVIHAAVTRAVAVDVRTPD